MRTRWVVLIVACVSTLLAGSSIAMTITVLPPGDGYWHNESGSSWDYFDAGADPNRSSYSFYGTSDTLQHNTSYAQFSLAAIPPGTPIESAFLNIYVLSAWLTGSTPDCGSVKHAADSGAADGNASQRIAGAEIVGIIQPQSDPGWLGFDITSQLQSDLDLGRLWSCFSFEANTTGDYSGRNAGFHFAGAESESNAAYLDVTLIPEPATLSLLCAGAALAALRRRAV